MDFRRTYEIASSDKIFHRKNMFITTNWYFFRIIFCWFVFDRYTNWNQYPLPPHGGDVVVGATGPVGQGSSCKGTKIYKIYNTTDDEE